jgi:metal-sulfur cluster biosynthetic enzyme
MIKKERIRDSLREVVDPCSAATGSNLDIVEMGLVKSIQMTENTVYIEMRITTPACHMIPYFMEEIEDSVSAHPDIDTVEVETDNGFEWSRDMMTEEAKRRRQSVIDEHKRRHIQEQTAE